MNVERLRSIVLIKMQMTLICLNLDFTILHLTKGLFGNIDTSTQELG